MSDLNLYNELQIDPRSSIENIREYLSKLYVPYTNAGSQPPEQLNLAAHILGDPVRRQMYDSVLYDPTAAPITIESLRNLAAMPVQPQPASPSQSQQGYAAPQQPNTAAAPFSQKPRSRGIFQPITPLIAVLTCLVTAAIFALGVVISQFFADPTPEDQAMDLSKDYISLSTPSATNKWLDAHTLKDDRSLAKKTSNVYSTSFKSIKDEFEINSNPGIAVLKLPVQPKDYSDLNIDGKYDSIYMAWISGSTEARKLIIGIKGNAAYLVKGPDAWSYSSSSSSSSSHSDGYELYG